MPGRELVFGGAEVTVPLPAQAEVTVPLPGPGVVEAVAPVVASKRANATANA